jgi:hypothetical protein
VDINTFHHTYQSNIVLKAEDIHLPRHHPVEDPRLAFRSRHEGNSMILIIAVHHDLDQENILLVLKIIEDRHQEDHEVVHHRIVLDMEFLHLCLEITPLKEDIMTCLALANRMQEMSHIHDIAHHHRIKKGEVDMLITTDLRDLDHLTFRKGIMEEDMIGDHRHQQMFMMLGIENSGMSGIERLWDLLLLGRTHQVVRGRLGGCLVVGEDIEPGLSK